MDSWNLAIEAMRASMADFVSFALLIQEFFWLSIVEARTKKHEQRAPPSEGLSMS